MDGSAATVVSGDDVRAAVGPRRYADLFVGEHHDATRELTGWSTPAFDDAGWRPVMSEDGGLAVLTPFAGEPVRRTRGAVHRRPREREGERPVPHHWEHVLWVCGHDDLETFIPFADGVHLDGVVEQITVPFLIAHGANDRQIPVEYAHRSYDQAVHAPKRDLRIFTPEEGASEHIGLDPARGRRNCRIRASRRQPRVDDRQSDLGARS